MNKSRFFDRYQLIITIVAIAASLLATIFFIIMLFTATIVYDEAGEISKLVYNDKLTSVYGIFFCLQLLAIVWFIARAITYKLREKEQDNLL